MTRGQESLLIDEEMLEITIAPVNAERRARGAVVLLASAEEMESHEHALLDIGKASGWPTALASACANTGRPWRFGLGVCAALSASPRGPHRRSASGSAPGATPCATAAPMAPANGGRETAVSVSPIDGSRSSTCPRPAISRCTTRPASCASCSTARSTTSSDLRETARGEAATCSAPARTPKSFSPRIASGARTASRASTACSPSRCTTAAADGLHGARPGGREAALLRARRTARCASRPS